MVLLFRVCFQKVRLVLSQYLSTNGIPISNSQMPIKFMAQGQVLPWQILLVLNGIIFLIGLTYKADFRKDTME